VTIRASLSPTSIALVAVICSLMAAAIVGGCGPNRRTRTLKATLTAINAARDGFVAWDRDHQHQIVEKATTRDTAQLELDSYRMRREAIVAGFTAAYRALAAAATSGDEASLRAALAAAGELHDALKKLMGGA
jgi:hypothetical protein